MTKTQHSDDDENLLIFSQLDDDENSFFLVNLTMTMSKMKSLTKKHWISRANLADVLSAGRLYNYRPR